MLNPFLPPRKPKPAPAPAKQQTPPQLLLNPIGTSATGAGTGGTQTTGQGPGGTSVNIGNSDPNAAHGVQPGPYQPPAPAAHGYMDPAVAAALRKLMGQGSEDVAGQEALARDESARATGQALADSRARSGFGGFALSGAAQGMDAGIRSQAANDLMKNIFGIHQQGRDNEFRNLGLASDAFGQESNRQFGAEQNTADRTVQQSAIDAAIAAINGDTDGDGTPNDKDPSPNDPNITNQGQQDEADKNDKGNPDYPTRSSPAMPYDIKVGEDKNFLYYKGGINHDKFKVHK